MIRVTIVDDARIIKSVSKIEGEDVLMAWAQENEKSPGHSIFSKQGEILDIVDKDNIFELLVRATLNFLDLQKIERGFCKNEALFPELVKLGFVVKDGVCEVDITTFFKPCCGCK